MSLKPIESHHTFKIAVIGGGRRCLSFLKLLESKRFNRFNRFKVEIAGVADINPRAPGIQYAEKKGIYTTPDYNTLLALPNLQLVLNLTSDPDFSNKLNSIIPETLPVLNHIASRLLQEILQDVFSSTQQIAQQEEEITLNNAFTQAIAEVTVVGAMVIDTHYRVIWINAAALKKIGLPKKEALSRYCFQIFHNAITPCDSESCPCPMKETLRTKRSAHVIHEHIMHGEERYCDISTFPLFNRKGEVVRVLEVVRDITEDMNDRLEHRTRAIKNDLARVVNEDKMISLGKMVASVAHEINNPIGSIINFNKLILKTIESGTPSPTELDHFKKYLELTIREAQRCGDIVSNLISFSRQQQTEFTTIDLSEMIQRIAMLFRHKMELSNIDLTLDLGDEPVEALGDYAQIQQCLINFVFNAMEAMPHGGTLTIIAGTDAVHNIKNETVFVAVSDTGIGIPDENLDKIFEPFFSTKTEISGVGLGLAMVYGIIKEHKGEIDVDSTIEKGTTFRVTLPSAQYMADTDK